MEVEVEVEAGEVAMVFVGSRGMERKVSEAERYSVVSQEEQWKPQLRRGHPQINASCCVHGRKKGKDVRWPT